MIHTLLELRHFTQHARGRVLISESVSIRSKFERSVKRRSIDAGLHHRSDSFARAVCALSRVPHTRWATDRPVRGSPARSARESIACLSLLKSTVIGSAGPGSNKGRRDFAQRQTVGKNVIRSRQYTARIEKRRGTRRKSRRADLLDIMERARCGGRGTGRARPWHGS